jgi:hypothetical protein
LRVEFGVVFWASEWHDWLWGIKLLVAAGMLGQFTVFVDGFDENFRVFMFS